LRDEDKDFLDPQEDGDLLSTARQRWSETIEATRDDKDQQAAAARFLAGEQWSPAALAARNGPGQVARPAFVIPLQSVYCKQVVSSWRSSPQAMRIRPKSGQASQDTAQVLEGLVRNIEQESQALIAYTQALEHAVSTGEGYFRLNLDYADPYSFRQQIKICAVPNRFSVYLDPAAQHPCGLDAEFGFVIDEMSWSRFCYTYDIDPGELELWHVQDRQQSAQHWITHTSVQVAEYFYRVWDDVTIVELPTGQVLRKDYLPDDTEIVQERTTRLPTVHWAKLTGMHVLEKTRWLGQYIPLIRVPGDVSLYDGKKMHTGMTQPSMDAQSSYNYFVSAQTEAIGMTPKAPYLVTPKQIAGFETYWNRANDASLPYLLWNPDVVGGSTLVPSPQRQVIEPAVQAISMARGMAAADIQSTLGMFSAAIGEPSNEKSGVAIQERRGESNQSNSAYAANMGWALETCGKQVLDLIKALHADPQTVRTVGMDGKTDQVRINQPIQAGPTGQQQPHWLQQGDYDCICDSGPSYTSQREMAAEKLGELGRVLPPELLPLVADLWVGSLDIPFSTEIAARLKTVVPPEALAATEQKDPQTVLAQTQNQLAQVTQQTQQMQQQLQEATQIAEVSKQQVVLLEQEVATSKTRLADKSQDNQLQAQKQQQEYDIELAKLRLEEQKLQLEIFKANQPQPTAPEGA
jgi:hypothetical protein